MECPDCGAFASEEDQFCGECGRPLSSEAAPDEQPRPPDAVDQITEILEPSQPPPLAAPVTPGAKKGSSPARLLILVGIALLLLCLCAGGALVWWNAEDEPVGTPAVSEPGLGTLLYEDDFGDPSSGWSTFSGDDTSAGYMDGEYRLAIHSEDYMVWGNPEPGPEFEDFSVEVDARHVEGPLDNNLGLAVRLTEDGDQFYWFQVSSDGFYSVDLKQGDEWTGLVGWKESDAINQGVGATNHLMVVCSGNLLSFYVNGSHLTDVTDDALPSGGIGLAAGTFDEPGVAIHFDNLTVHSVLE